MQEAPMQRRPRHVRRAALALVAVGLLVAAGVGAPAAEAGRYTPTGITSVGGP